MNRQQLEQFTHNPRHHGLNSQSIFAQFMRYQGMCRDPLLVFRFMEEKAICTFLPIFWVSKANLLAEIGDYSGCFESLEMARSITEEEEKSTLEMINQHNSYLIRNMLENMRKFPLSGKRSVCQCSLPSLNSNNLTKVKLEELLKLYKDRYQSLRNHKEQQAQRVRSNKFYSWMAEHYRKHDQNQIKIQEEIHQHSVMLSREVKYHSLHTPIRNRDPQRLTKTMDSVEMLKKKRSTKDKRRHPKHIENNDSQNENDPESSGMMNSLPVGRKFEAKKRRVTFSIDSNKQVQKLRHSEVPSSFVKLSANNSKESQMDEEEQVFSQPHTFTK